MAEITISIPTETLVREDEFERAITYLRHMNQSSDTVRWLAEDDPLVRIEYVPPHARKREIAEHDLHENQVPVWCVTDDQSSFALWLYADGSDSEG